MISCAGGTFQEGRRGGGEAKFQASEKMAKQQQQQQQRERKIASLLRKEGGSATKAHIFPSAPPSLFSAVRSIPKCVQRKQRKGGAGNPWIKSGQTHPTGIRSGRPSSAQGASK